VIKIYKPSQESSRGFSTSLPFSYRKEPINVWIRQNYLDRNIPLPHPNNEFVYKKLCRGHDPTKLWRTIVNRDNWRDRLNLFSSKLEAFKLNYNIEKNNYIFYLKNTPNTLIVITCTEAVDSFYKDINDLLWRKRYNIKSLWEFKYGLVSLWLFLGNRLINYYCKYMYTLYTDHFRSLSVTGHPYTKFKITIENKVIELDYYLSFTEFKNILIREVGWMDTGDIIKYGHDLYLFILYNIFIYNITDSEKSTLVVSENLNKSLTIYVYYKGRHLGLYYPSRNEMNKSIVNINFNNILP
jgi:hypothetical protein